MPGQPAWTLTEMLECNLPLCWAGGGDCNVGPALIVGGPFLFLFLSPLGLYVLWAKHMSSRRSVFILLEQKTEAAVCVFSWSKKIGVLGVFLEQKNLERVFF